MRLQIPILLVDNIYFNYLHTLHEYNEIKQQKHASELRLTIQLIIISCRISVLGDSWTEVYDRSLLYIRVLRFKKLRQGWEHRLNNDSGIDRSMNRLFFATSYNRYTRDSSETFLSSIRRSRAKCSTNESQCFIIASNFLPIIYCAAPFSSVSPPLSFSLFRFLSL